MIYLRQKLVPLLYKMLIIHLYFTTRSLNAAMFNWYTIVKRTHLSMKTNNLESNQHVLRRMTPNINSKTTDQSI